MADPTRTKALALLRDGRLTVVDATLSREGGPLAPACLAVVKDGRESLSVERRQNGTVYCECCEDAADAPCAHAYALRLVTGGSA